jgi:hypothetical protein
MNIDADDLDYP